MHSHEADRIVSSPFPHSARKDQLAAGLTNRVVGEMHGPNTHDGRY